MQKFKKKKNINYIEVFDSAVKNKIVSNLSLVNFLY